MIKTDKKAPIGGAGGLTQAQMMQKKFEYENEVIEEELYQWNEAENEKMFKEKPWRQE